MGLKKVSDQISGSLFWFIYEKAITRKTVYDQVENAIVIGKKFFVCS